MCHRPICGPKRDKVTGGWRKLPNETPPNFYSSPSIIRIIKSRKMRWVGHVARVEEKRNAYRLLVEKPEGKRPLRRPRCRWVQYIKMDLEEVEWEEGIDWIRLAQDRDTWRPLVNAIISIWAP
jgi:hypothetical protein